MKSIDEIRAAIKRGEAEQARQLLREALKTEQTAELFLLCAQVAVNDLQKKRFIEKALELDPFHADAMSILGQAHVSKNIQKVTQPIQPSPTQSPAKNSNRRSLLLVLGILAIIVLVIVMINNANEKRRREEIANRPTRIPPTPTISIKSYTLSIQRKTNTGILLYPGDTVKVNASGKIKVSPFWNIIVGPTGANDAEEIFVGDYSIVNRFRHGALMYSMTTADEWYYCGSSCDFSVLETANSGYLEFEVNDDDQANNTGSFTIEVTVIHR